MSSARNSTARNSLSQSLAKFGNRSVLIVSDKDVLFRTIRDCLRDAGMQKIAVVPNRKATWEKLNLESSDLLIVDLDVDSNDAIELITEVKNHEIMFQTPIIALTGHAMKEFILKAARAGADDVIVKPFPLKQLRDRVAFALGKK
jgi:DNA-binding response OmpR family regulator